MFQATNQLRKLKEEHPTSWHKLDSIKKYGVFKGVIWNQVLTLQEDTYEWKEAVCNCMYTVTVLKGLMHASKFISLFIHGVYIYIIGPAA